MKITTTLNVFCLVIAPVLALAAPAMAQTYPSKPITIISAQASGGASD
jgi:tripartite-type tricarboxylate transporter receptor subunit TctC